MKLNIFEEKILFSRLKSKDKEAFIKAYDLYIDDIYRFVYFKIGHKEEAQDLTSQVFLKTWNHIQTNSLTDHKTLRSLIYKIARNAVVDYYRENSGKIISSLNDENNEISIVDANQNLARQMEINHDFSLVEKKLSELKDEYNEVIVLRYIEELSIGEIADILDKTKGNVRILTYRALKALKELMGENEK